ncbi:transposase [Amaricoccus solimangrovi]|uniref:Transposase n=1 Tax=Amaricoccus solimangrovi TaxID=2589815 RepID=A0A501W714_9RHOB|nr:transposase [Amaricoccus solimangrovi]TPE45703.1 transposase [Amaricoccus solimangrovi]
MDEKSDVKPGATEASAPPTRAPHAGGGGAEAGPGKRFSAKMKLAAVQRLMRGESLEALSRELNVPAHRLSEWRDRVLIAAESALKERERDARDEDIERLKAKVGEITMTNELLYSKIERLEAGRPLAGRRSRR